MVGPMAGRLGGADRSGRGVHGLVEGHRSRPPGIRKAAHFGVGPASETGWTLVTAPVAEDQLSSPMLPKRRAAFAPRISRSEISCGRRRAIRFIRHVAKCA